LASGTPVVASETSAVGEFLLAGQKESVGITAGNTAAEFADAIEILMMQVETDSTLSGRCVEQAKKFTWATTASLLHATATPIEIEAA
jgi:alpha-1,6-mannosyltransferase